MKYSVSILFIYLLPFLEGIYSECIPKYGESCPIEDQLPKINRIYRKESTECVAPEDPKFPECKGATTYMQANWKTDFYKKHGVDGSLCSIIDYLSKVEKKCPCIIPKDSHYPECEGAVTWMKENWHLHANYKQKGVDGTVCSIINYLSTVEQKCPCIIPKDSKYPECEGAVTWLKQNWHLHAVYNQKGVNGTVCSVITYLSTVEKKCPCIAPAMNPQYPECRSSAIWLKDNWHLKSIYKWKGVDGSMCSIINYLIKVEKKCPPMHK